MRSPGSTESPPRNCSERSSKAAGVEVKAASQSSVDEAAALRVLADGMPPRERAPEAVSRCKGRGRPRTEPRTPLRARRRPRQAPPAVRPPSRRPPSVASRRGRTRVQLRRRAGDARRAGRRRPRRSSRRRRTSRRADGEHAHKRPTRDSLQGERSPGNVGGRRRVVIDSQASRRAPGGPGAVQPNQPPRRQRRGGAAGAVSTTRKPSRVRHRPRSRHLT